MKSPRAEWSLLVAYFIALDVMRARGEADSDTLSECARESFRVHTPRGRIAWRFALVGGGLLLDRHICKEPK